MVSHEHQCVFIHIPKTGGESIVSLFDQFDKDIPKHANASQVKRHIGEEKWNRYFKFTIIRNPWDLAVSMYSHLRKPLYMKDELLRKYGKVIINPVNACKTACTHDFGTYCHKIYKRKQQQKEAARTQWPVRHFAPVDEWISDKNGNSMIDYIGRFEQLENEIKFIIKKLALHVAHLPFENKSSHAHYTTFYDEKSKFIIHDYYKTDIEKYNYFFEGQST